MSATPFVANPSGYTNVQIKVEIGVERFLVSRKAVHHGATELVTKVAQHGNKCLAGVALVQKDRQAAFGGDAQLVFQGFDLCIAGREVAVEIQSAFTDRFDRRVGAETFQLLIAISLPLFCPMRMHASSSKQALGKFRAVLDDLVGMIERGSGQQHLADASLPGPLQYSRAVLDEGLVSQVDANINPIHGATA